MLGRSCKLEEDVYIERCRTDHIPVLRRMGGGGTVLLTEGVIVISLAGNTTLPFHLREHMNSVNSMIIQTLKEFHVKNLSVKGISDIVLGNKKICGSSLHRKRDTILYQGSLLLCPDIQIFDRYLKHPKKEPDYRNGRKHQDFITSLWEEGYRIDKEDLISALKHDFSKKIPWSGQ